MTQSDEREERAAEAADGEFLECWLASGCFASHNFDYFYEIVKPHLPPNQMPPSKNRWVAAYKRQFPEL